MPKWDESALQATLHPSRWDSTPALRAGRGWHLEPLASGDSYGSLLKVTPYFRFTDTARVRNPPTGLYTLFAIAALTV